MIVEQVEKMYPLQGEVAVLEVPIVVDRDLC